MKAPTRRKVSYVIRQPNGEQAHCLGVNSLAIDTCTVERTSDVNAQGGVLFSAGRDGVIAGWDLHMAFQKTSPHASEDTGDLWTLDREAKAPNATCKVFSQMHTDWVNDVVVCEQGTVVISASSDRAVKLWRPYSDTPESTYTVGWHTDYAKCLAYARNARWVASGGLDKKVNIWDLERGEAALAIHTGPINYNDDTQTDTGPHGGHSPGSKASVYAMAVDPAGTLLATGSPEKVVRLWDPRSGKRVGKLTGHTDNIRALLMSHDGQVILSGSSDSTIKLWSVKAQRCLVTYETHPDSVWALYSDHPSLRTFYAGSRDGLVTRTEISGEDMAGENECIGLFKEKTSVSKIVALSDTYVWTATSDASIHRWLSVPSRESRQILHRSELNPEIPASATVQLPPTKAAFSSYPSDPFLGSDNLTLYAGSVMSIPASYNNEEDTDTTETLTPLRDHPDQTILGVPGIASHMVLHNRRHVLTKYTDGEVALWDLVNCALLKKYGQVELEQVAQDVNGMESFPSWCAIDTKIGAITVQLTEGNCFDCEMYADEMEISEGYGTHEDQRINLGKWVLATLFAHFTEAILKQQPEEMASRPALLPSSRIPSTPMVQSYPAPPTPLKLPLTAITANTDTSPFQASSQQNVADTMFNGPHTAPPTTGQQFDYFSGAHHPSPTRRESAVQLPPPAASPPTTNIISRLKHLSVKAKLSRPPTGDSAEDDEQDGDESDRRDSSAEAAQTQPSVSTPSQQSDPVKTTSTPTEPRVFSPPQLDEFPPLAIPPATAIIFTEESAEASAGMDLYRGTVSSVGNDTDLIMESAPSWLLTYLLYNKTPTKDTVKLTFILKPAEGTALPEIPGGPNNRLLANRVLRVRKLAAYVAEKLNVEADQIELLCNETVLSVTMTLAMIKQHVLKASGDIPLAYRYISERGA